MLGVCDTTDEFVDDGGTIARVDDDGAPEGITQGLEDGGDTIGDVDDVLRRRHIVGMQMELRKFVQAEVTT